MSALGLRGKPRQPPHRDRALEPRSVGSRARRGNERADIPMNRALQKTERQTLGAARATLRSATRALHVQLEHGMTVTSPDLTLADYAQTLRRMLEVYTPLEKLIDAHEVSMRELGLNWAQRRKAALLERDLVAIAPEFDVSTLGRAPDVLPSLPSLAEAMGCLYVLEGSTLGGQFVARHVESALGLRADNGAAFFQSYGPAVGRFWQEFCSALELGLPDRPSRERAARTANATFELFIRHARNEHDAHDHDPSSR